MQRSPSGAQWTISSGDQQAVVVEVGGGLRAYRAGDREILDGYAEADLCPGGAGQVLAPWPNRLRDGRYTFQGNAYQLPLSEPVSHTAIHGLVRWVSWRLVEQAPDAVTIELDLHAQPGYPWSLHLTNRYEISAEGITVTHEAVNLADTPAPFGLGAHPYLLPPGGSVDEALLGVPGRTRLLLDSRGLPIGAAKIADTEWDYATPKRIGDVHLDLAFGWVVPDEQGRSEVTLSAPSGETTRVWADENFRWWQIYSADTATGDRRRRSVAAEPMTCPPDALRSGRDLIVLEPGQSWRGQWGIGR
ncbi:aldose 1-epimerase [Allocatelliglobosispora scoriae]|uniref:Aldose 1-epimerase n=1 Tax=Allocatelliglobosispora scoriae TaxID=643052 RepID=A0A841BNA3_9ACTN|nr:aldose 1-epimerase family protein [Allocatelliglobosispora scoriae]MBB5870567.1 aldose 1-epimerase [Allocatelliglobosispora scoriae]